MISHAEFRPSWASHPGETVHEIAQRKGLKRALVASALGVAEIDLPRVLDGDFPIDNDRAEKLAAQIGGTPRFWLARDAQYRNALKSLHENNRAWVSSVPFADMAKFGWLDTANTFAEKLRHLFAFFGVSSVDEWRDAWLSECSGLTAYRTSPVFATQAAAAAVWLRQGELAASHIRTNIWSSNGFERLLPDLKPLTRLHKPSEFLQQLQQKCATCGVAAAKTSASTSPCGVAIGRIIGV